MNFLNKTFTGPHWWQCQLTLIPFYLLPSSFLFATKHVCISAHILRVSKVLLQRGRYTSRHDTVLCEVFEAVKTFISNVKKAVPIPATSSLKFEKSSKSTPQKDYSSKHFTSCVMQGFLEDLNNNYCSQSTSPSFNLTWYNNFFKQFKKVYSHRANISLWRKL